MANKRDRRKQERRRHHQSTQTAQRREMRQKVLAIVESARTVLRELVDDAADGAVAPGAWADRLVTLLADEVYAEMLGTPALAVDEGIAIAGIAGEERARALFAELSRRRADEGRVAWMAAGIARGADDAVGAERIALDALAELKDPDDRSRAAVAVAGLQIDAGHLGDALDLLDQCCAATPEQEGLQELRARALAPGLVSLGHRGASSPGASASAVVDAEQLERVAAARARFADRSLLYELRESVELFVGADDELSAWRASWIADWIASARETGQLGPYDTLGGDEQLRLSHLVPGVGSGSGSGSGEGSADRGDEQAAGALEGALRLAAELSWLVGPDLDGDLLDEGDDEELLDEGETVLERFAADPSTPRVLADAARAWRDHVRYGLWQPQLLDPDDPPLGDGDGIWLTDLVTRRTLYASIPAEQLGGLPRWSVLACAMAPVGGVWRSGSAVLVLDPDTADEAVEKVLTVTSHVVAALARERGIKAPRPRRQDGSRPRPHGVIAELAEPMEPAEADITAKVLGSSFADLLGLVEARRRRAPTMTNTDGDPIELIRATYAADDPAAVRLRLTADPDFSSDELGLPGDGEIATQVTWLGKQMGAAEAASSLAQLRAEARKHGWKDIPEPDGPQRWVRGIIHFEPGRVRVEVNSRRRLELVTAALRRAGAQSEPRIELVTNPAMDSALAGAGGRPRSAGSPEAEAAWREHWLDERVPALDGATPRSAAKDPRRRVLLEALLRQWEHDADLAVAAGERPLDVAAIRAALQMEQGVLEDDLPEQL